MKIKEISKPDFRKVFENLTYYLIVAIAIVVFCFVLRLDILFRPPGGDAKVFCLSGQAIHQNNNPYLTTVLGTQMSWNYPPVLAHAFNLLCSQFGFEHNYIFLYLLFLLLALIPWLDGKSWLYGTVLCATGLYSLGWVFITGNIGTIEFFLFSLSAFFLLKGKNGISFFLLGLMASIKIIPILYFPIFLLFTKTTKERVRAILFTGVGFLLLIFISSITNFDLMPWYFRQLLGLIPEQHAAFKEYGAITYNYQFSSMVFSLFNLEDFFKNAGLIPPLLFFTLGLFLSCYLWTKVESAITSPKKLEIAFAAGVVIFTLLMPRLKPYSFLPALLFFYIASRNQKRSLQGMYVALLSIFPNFLYLTYFYFDNNKLSFLEGLPAFPAHLLQVIQTYHQTFFLFLATIVLLISIRTTRAQNVQLESGSEGIE